MTECPTKLRQGGSVTRSPPRTPSAPPWNPTAPPYKPAAPSWSGRTKPCAFNFRRRNTSSTKKTYMALTEMTGTIVRILCVLQPKPPTQRRPTMGSATCICGHEEDEHSLTGEYQALD